MSPVWLRGIRPGVAPLNGHRPPTVFYVRFHQIIINLCRTDYQTLIVASYYHHPANTLEVITYYAYLLEFYCHCLCGAKGRAPSLFSGPSHIRIN